MDLGRQGQWPDREPAVPGSCPSIGSGGFGRIGCGDGATPAPLWRYLMSWTPIAFA
jgi:hypothetical protein